MYRERPYTETPFAPIIPKSDERNFFDSMEDSLSVGYIADAIRAVNAPPENIDPNFDWYDSFKQLTPNYQDAFQQFAGATSAEEFNYIKQSIDQYRGAEAGRGRDGFLTTLLADVATSPLDPTTYIPIPITKGLGFVRGAAAFAASNAAITAGTETFGKTLNPNKTWSDVGQNIGGSILIGGLIGGGVGRIGYRPTIQGAAPNSSLSNFANAYFGQHSQAEGIAVPKTIDLDGQIRDIELGVIWPQGSFQQGYQANANAAIFPFNQINPFVRWIPETPATATSPLVPERLLVDEAAIKYSFNNAPWTQGNAPLPADAFVKPAEWLSFNILRAMQEKINPRLATETADAYDGRLTIEAYQQVRGAREPLGIAMQGFARIGQPGSANAIASKLFGNDTYLWDGLLSIAGDHGTLNLGNRANKESPDSAFLSAGRTMGKYIYDMQVTLNEKYAEYLSGSVPTGMRTVTAIKNSLNNAPLFGKWLRDGKVDERTFRELVGVATEHPGVTTYKGMDITPEMHAVGDAHRKILNEIDEYARTNGLYEDIVTVNKDIAHLNLMIDKTENFLESQAERLARGNLTPNRTRWLQDTILRVSAQLADHQNRLITAQTRLSDLTLNPRQVSGAPSYFPHVYRLDVIRERRAEFEQIVTDIFIREGNLDPNGSAKAAIKSILGENPTTPGVGVSQAAYLKQREIPGSILEMGDFLELDSQLVLRGYLQKIIPALEITRKFGDYRMSQKLDEVRQYLNMKLLNEPNREAAQRTYDDTIQLFEDMRDRVLGNYGVFEPLELTKNGARLARGVTSLTYMGQVIYASFADAARVLGTLGAKNVFHGFASYLQHDLKDIKIQQRYAPAVGEALDIILGSALQRFNGGTESVLRRDGNMVTRAVEGAQGPYFIANLLSPWTVSMKQFASLVGSHVIIKDCLYMASQITKGLEPNPKIAAQLASFGINRADALLIAKMPHTKTESGKLHLTNISEWVGKEGLIAQEKFKGALQGRLRQSVTTPGLMDRPGILDGVIYKRSTRQAIERDLNTKRSELTSLRDQLRSLTPQQANPTVRAQMDAILAEMKTRRTEIGQIQGSQAAKSRGGTPLLTLPTQYMAFPFAMATKMAQSVATGREKSAVTGMITLFGLSYLANWAKSSDFAWDKKSETEKLYDAFSRSGIAGWLETPGRVADILLDAGPRSALGLESPTGKEPGIPDKLGAVGGPSVSLVSNVFDAMFNPDHGIDERFAQIRRNLPFANHLLVKPLLKFLGDEVVEPIFGKTNSRDVDLKTLSEFQSMAGSTYGTTGDDAYVFPEVWEPAATPLSVKRAALPAAPAPVQAPTPIIPIVEGNPGARDQATLPARAAAPALPDLPAVEPAMQMAAPAEPPAQPELPFVEPMPQAAVDVPVPAAAPIVEGNPGARDQTPFQLIERPPQPQGNSGLRDQPTLPARAEAPIVEGDPGARDQTAWVLRQPEGEPGRRDQTKWTVIDRPEGDPEAREQPIRPARAAAPAQPPLPSTEQLPPPQPLIPEPRKSVIAAPRLKRYVAAMEVVESGGRRTAVNPKSGAAGPHQFLKSTWKAVTAQMGETWGPDDRFDREKSTQAVVFFTNQNRKILEKGIGRKTDEADLYTAHLLGASGAVRFITGYELDPTQPATNLVDKGAAKNNRNIFFDLSTGRARTADEVRALLKNKIERAMARDVASN